MTKLILSIVTILVVTGLYILNLLGKPHVPDVVLSNVSKVYEVININHPKHFTVDLLDVDNGSIYRSVYISKHCSYADNLKLHSRWRFNEVVYENKQGDHYKEIDGVDGLCDRLKNI